MVKCKNCYIKFLWGLLTFSLCVSAPKTCRQQTCLGTAWARLTPLSPPRQQLFRNMMSWWLQWHHPYAGRIRTVPNISDQDEGKGKLNSLCEASCAAPSQTGSPPAAETVPPPQHSPFLHPNGGSSLLQAHATWRLRLHFCNCVAPDSQHRFTEQLRLEGASGCPLVQKRLSALAQLLFVLLHPLQTVQGVPRPSSLALLTRLLKRWGMKSIHLFWLRFFKVLPHAFWRDGLAQHHTPAKFCWRWGLSGGEVVREVSWQQSCAWGNNTGHERDWPDPCGGVLYLQYRQHWGLSQRV